MVLSENLRGIVMMTAAMATFTINDTFVKLATKTVPLPEAIVIRGLLVMLLLVLVGHARGGLVLRLGPGDKKSMILRSLGEVGGTVTFLLALQHMPLASLSAIMQSLPLAVTLGAALILREKVGWRRMLAISIGFCGVLLIIRPGGGDFNSWSLVALASVGFVVLRDLSTRNFSKGLPTLSIAFYAALAVVAMGIIWSLFTSGWRMLTLPELGQLAAAACMLILGYLCVVAATRQGDVALIAPFRYTALIFAILLGWLIFGNLPTGLTLLGASIVVATGIYTFWREHRLHRRIAASRASMIGAASPDR